MKEINVTKMTKTRLWAFALSDNGYFIALNLFTVFPVIFMTKCLELAVPTAVSVIAIGKLIDLIVGFMIGSIIEKVKFPWGKYRSWLLVGPIISGIAACLFYSTFLQSIPVPAIIPVGAILIALWNFGGSVCRTTYGALNNALTKNPQERVKMTKLGMQMQAITGFVGGLVMMPIVYAVGGEQTINLKGMQTITVIFSFLYFIFYFNFFINLRDYKEDKNSDMSRRKVRIYDALVLLLTNGKVFMLTLSGLVCSAAQILLKSMITYVFIYSLLSERQVSLFNWMSVIAAFIGSTVVTFIVKRMSKKSTYGIGYLIFAGALVLGFFLRNIPYATLFCVCLAYFGMNIARPVGVPMYSDIADYIKSKTGENKTTIVMTVFNLQFKISGFIASMGTSLIAAAGFQTGVDPTQAVRNNIAAMGLFVPAGLALIGAYITLVLYRLDEKKLNEMVAVEKA